MHDHCSLFLNANISEPFEGKSALIMGFPGGSVVKNLLTMQKTQVQSLSWEDSLKEGVATHSRTLAWRIPMDRGAWWATVHRVTELDMTEGTKQQQRALIISFYP